MDFIISNILVLGIFLVTFISMIIGYTIYVRKLKKQINELKLISLKQNSYIVSLETTIEQIELVIKKKQQQKDNEKHIAAMKLVKQNLGGAKTHSKVGKTASRQSNGQDKG